MIRLFPVTEITAWAKSLIHLGLIGQHDYDDCDHAEHETIFADLVRHGADLRVDEFTATVVLAVCNGEITIDVARALFTRIERRPLINGVPNRIPPMPAERVRISPTCWNER